MVGALPVDVLCEDELGLVAFARHDPGQRGLEDTVARITFSQGRYTDGHTSCMSKQSDWSVRVR